MVSEKEIGTIKTAFRYALTKCVRPFAHSVWEDTDETTKKQFCERFEALFETHIEFKKEKSGGKEWQRPVNFEQMTPMGFTVNQLISAACGLNGKKNKPHQVAAVSKELQHVYRILVAEPVKPDA